MASPPTDRVIVLGIDGMSPPILEPLLEAGQLPAFARLKAAGAYRRLATSNPSQSPVAWSTIATGANPGRHGVFDFLRRDPRHYLPELAILRVNPRNVLGRRESMFLPVRRGTAFWSVTSAAGIPTSVIRWPLTLPTEEVTGHMLAGLGAPDLKANLGRYTLYTTREISQAEAQAMKGDLVRLPRGSDTFRARIAGPERAQLPVHIHVDRQARAVALQIAGTTHQVREGQWSDCVRLRFSVHLVKKVHALCRFHLASVAPDLELYLSPLEADPRKPAFALTHPDDYAARLAEAIGDYHTLGMPEDTNALQDGCLSTGAFLALCDSVMAEREKMLWHEVDRLDRGLLAFVFDTTDRIQHAFWAARDPGHPAYDEALAQRHGSVIEDYYRRMDGILGKLLDGMDERTALIVLSDHGFTSFRRAVHLNSWLVDNGLMALKDPSADRGASLFRNVDWRNTRAYALGFSSIYLNLKGREDSGTVDPADAFALKAAIGERLARLDDGGERVFERIYDSAKLYTGPCASEAPDLVVGFRPGYRTSWQTAVGGSPEGLIEDNRESWSGDHLVDPIHVPGILLLNRGTSCAPPHLRDIAPTILQLLGLASPSGTDGQSLVGR